MPDNKIIYHIIAYDISDPKRLVKVHKKVKSYGMALQYSVFIAPLDRAMRKHLMDELNAIIQIKEDDIRIYPLPRKARVTLLGNTMLPNGIFMNNSENELTML